MSRSEALCIRRISSPEDIKDCLRFVLRVFRETAGREFDDEGRASFSAFIYSGTIEKSIEDGSGRLCAAYEGEKLAGVSLIRENRHISLLFVRPDMQKKGIGSALLQKMTEGSEEYLTVNAAPTGYAFYKKKGFYVREKEKTLDGITFTLMEKKIH